MLRRSPATGSVKPFAYSSPTPSRSPPSVPPYPQGDQDCNVLLRESGRQVDNRAPQVAVNREGDLGESGRELVCPDRPSWALLDAVVDPGSAGDHPHRGPRSCTIPVRIGCRWRSHRSSRKSGASSSNLDASRVWRRWPRRRLKAPAAPVPRRRRLRARGRAPEPVGDRARARFQGPRFRPGCSRASRRGPPATST